MNDALISQYIDNELNLEEKIDFVETVHADRAFKDSAVALLVQEKALRAEAFSALPLPALRPAPRPRRPALLRPLMAAAAALVFAAFLFWPGSPLRSPQPEALRPFRFVIYQPEATQVELAGSFNAWQRIALKSVGADGYWEVTVALPAGEHRFSYIVQGDRRLADPTLPVRESDDFGGQNSILTVPRSI